MPAFLPASILPSPPSERRVPLWASLLICFFFLCLLIFLNLGRWLVREDPLQKADAIAVLSGHMPGRALEAARVYNQGLASEVWLTHSTEPGNSLKKLSIEYVGEDSYDRQILLHEGVPEGAIHILDPPILNTADEITTISRALQQKNLRSVILVTSKVHTRRTNALWKRLAAPGAQALVHGVTDESFDPVHWWRTTSDALDVVRELLGLLNVWAGLPLRPSA